MLVKGTFILYVILSFYFLDNSIVHLPWAQEKGMGVCHICTAPVTPAWHPLYKAMMNLVAPEDMGKCESYLSS